MKFPFRRGAKPIEAGPANDTAQAEQRIAEGHRLEDAGDAQSARTRYERAVEVAPRFWRGHLNLGNALRLLGEPAAAGAAYRRAIALNPDFAGAHLNLGNILIIEGDLTEAADAYRNALRLRPDWADAWFGLACVFDRQTSTAQAIEACEKALALEPTHATAAALLAGLLIKDGDARAAVDIVETALRQHPRNVALLLAKADFAKQMGHAAVAVAAYREALGVTPDDLAIWSAYLFTLNLDESVDAKTILAEHVKFGDLIARRIPPTHRRAARDEQKRLRIGYVSPDFRRHSVACFVEPLLTHHDRAAVDVHCYYTHDTRDDITQRFVALADRWQDVAADSDEALAQRIVDDGIDILIDLSGHTTGNRLGVFARKPAPLQFTWLGYLCTTGMRSIDYRLCDVHTDPPGIAENWQVEQPARLANSQWCYQPQAPLPPPSSLPRIARGYWTFGSFNQSSKLNRRLLTTWANLLASIEHSRLRIVGTPNALFEDDVRAIFAAAGVATDRLELIGRLPLDEYFSSYAEVDIALDSSPYNGATTTCDALLMGVPVAAIAGKRSISRSGASLLSVLGLNDWIAPSPDALVSLLQRHVGDVDAIAALRATLPDRMRASALMDGARFARDVETVLRTAWAEQCRKSA